VEFGELGGRLVEIFVVEFGDAPLLFLHLGAAVVVEFLGGGANGGDEVGSWELGKGEGFEASCRCMA